MKFRRKNKERSLDDRTYKEKNRRTYYRDSIALFFRKIFRKFMAYRVIGICFGMLALLFAISVFFSKAGEFVVTVDKDMADTGFVISEEKTFKNAKIKLFSKALEGANNINILDLPENINQIDGSHNGDNYIAYTYYIQNAGQKDTDYTYELDITSSSLGLENAAWIMVFQNGKETVYAKEGADGNPECQYSYEPFAIAKTAKDEKQVISLTEEETGYLTEEEKERIGLLRVDGLYEFRTIPFTNDNVVCLETRKGMKPGEIDKYTVVVWLEGEDPECVDDILGGHISMKMQFKLVEEKK
ncbi:hypothetical protein [Anaerosporobacter faecicola]|uniref:hypothetical protein n=1 Tax=Anaerosporobacter faecicola TaxID=2718714 RepID=UPI00143915E8|nr:hypothetical protein [Anaerosporobacter faecicola]